ncbi:MAG: glycoside hydrolase domain-containing protein, partial [Bacteroidota bacterium]
PVTPGSNEYIIGTPLINKATINLENGNQFTISSYNLSDSNSYVDYVKLNGKDLNRTYLTHEEIVTGGTLEFYMTDQPAEWGSREGQEPSTSIEEHLIVPAPFIAKGDVAFKNETEVVLSTIDSPSEIFYRFNSGDFQLYDTPFIINEPSTLEVYSADGYGNKSATISTEFYKIDPNISITLETEYANQYNAGGDEALIDGIIGTEDFRTGTWQGYWNEDVNATIDLGSVTGISNIKASFLRDQRSWIFLPTSASILISDDGINFIKAKDFEFDTPFNTDEVIIESIQLKNPGSIRFIKLVANKLGELPEWHLGHENDGRSWIFIDEIQIKKQVLNE